MSDNFEQLKKLSLKVHLESERKTAMRERLVNFITAHEAVKAQTARAPFSWAQKFVLPVSAFALLLLMGTGTSLAAENALPGDPLYIVKTKINEPLVAALTPSESAKAEWNATVALRRLEEADTLALQGKLTPENKAQIQTNFEGSAAKAEATIASLDQKGDGDSETADDLSAKFESSLKAHAEILAQLTPSSGSSAAASAAASAPAIAAVKGGAAVMSAPQDNSEDSLVVKIRSTIASMAARHGDEESKIADNAGAPGAAAAAQGKIGAATNVIASVKDFIDNNSDKLSADALAAATARLDAAGNILASSTQSAAAGNFKLAFTLANQALRKAQETRVLAAAQLQVGDNQDTAGDAVSAAPAKTLNLLMEKNPQDDASTSDDNVIMNSVTITVTTTPPTLNVDGTKETESP